MLHNHKHLRWGISQLPVAALCAIAIALIACTKLPAESVPTRSVRTLVTTDVQPKVEATYAGEIRPRRESNLGFRVPGKILSRHVDVGEQVSKGQLLMRLDVQDLALNESASRATVAAQEAQFAVEKADFERFAKLARTGYISRAGFDRQKTHFEAARAQLDAVKAQARVSGNQASYAALRADVDGTITAVAAEAGQVVAAGSTVVRVARNGELEVASDIPEQQVAGLKPGQAMDVALWTSGDRRYPGRLRELASSANPATRTYSIRVGIDNPPPEMKLGMTASVIVPMTAARSFIRIPLSAYVQQREVAGVWVFDPTRGIVNFRPVQVVGIEGNEALVGGGLTAGERIVTAGANLLEPGQSVRLLDAVAADG